MISGNDWILLICTLAYITLVVYIPIRFKQLQMISSYAARKVIHIFSGLTVFAVPMYHITAIPLTISLVVTATTLYSNARSKVKPLRDVYETIKEDDEISAGYLQGPFAYGLAITFATLYSVIIPKYMGFALVPILLMIFSDTLASLVGKRYGKIVIPFAKNNRTLEGSYAFFLSGFLVSIIGYYLMGRLSNGLVWELVPVQLISLSVLTSLCGTFVEIMSPSKWDDLIIPVGTTSLLTLLGILL